MPISYGCLVCQQLNPRYFFVDGSFQAFDVKKAYFLVDVASERSTGL